MTSKKAWLNHTNVYEVNLRQYTEEGTFTAFAKHLPRLKQMGVKTLWFMPLTPIAQEQKKGSMGSYYACSDYTSVNPEFGTLHDFKSLVKQAHKLGFRVIIDWVANHTGWDHVWTTEHPDWYEKDEETGTFRRASGMDDIIELDFRNTGMRKAMIEAMMFWVRECDIDGFRCDLAFWVPLDFWIEAKKELDKVKELFWLAEADPLDHPEYMQVFDAAYSWTWMHKTEDFFKNGLHLHDLIVVLEKYRQAPGIKAWFTSNHDENTWNGTEYEKYGNAALLLAVFSCTWPGIPLIYSGQELPNLKRLQFFDKDVIEWNEVLQLHEFYKTLLHLQTSNPALKLNSKFFRIHSSGDEKVLGYLRKSGAVEIVVLLNFSGSFVRLELFDCRVGGRFENVFNSQVVDFGKDRFLEIKEWQFLVLRKTGGLTE
jgi:alpha-amylase